MIKQLHLLSLLLISSLVGAQTLEVTDGTTDPFTPENLISNIFLGEGVEVIDIEFEGDPRAVGFFKDGETAIGINRGLVMTTGRAANASPGGPFGADGVGSNFASNDANSSATDPDIEDITTVGVDDVCKYTIRFIPTSDTLRFNYVFASEEYPEFACDAFNDVFGFFISGPGINGGFENNGENIALIPGTNTPVAINNVHPQNGPNCPPAFEQFYNNNNFSSVQPTYDGYLDVFTAQAVVVPCQEYTIKLIIADGGDMNWDSGVYLEAKSFGTGSLQVEAATVSLDGTITEGCSDGSLTFKLPSPVENDFPIDYTIIGTAENGVDYEFVPSDLFIPAGDSSVSVPIIAIVDDIDEDLETIGIDVQRDICNRDTFYIFIRDNELISPVLGIDTTICEGDSVQLDGTLNLQLPPPPSFTNSNDIPILPELTSITSDVLVAGVQPVFLEEGLIQSVCMNIQHPFLADLDIFLLSPGGQFIELTTDNGQDCDDYFNTCFTPSATVPLTDVVPIGFDCAAGEASNFVGDFSIEGVWSDLYDGENPTNGIWQLLVFDDQNGFDGVILDWTITFEPIYRLNYRWEPTTGLSCADCPNPVARPTETTNYTLFVTDTYGCEVSDDITINVTELLEAPDVTCGTITNTSITFNWDAVAGSTGYQVNINNTGWIPPNNGVLSHLVDGLSLSDTITLQVQAIADCGGEIATIECWTPECDAPILSIDMVEPVSCFAGNNGAITVSATGGSAGSGYVYTLNGTANTTGVYDNLTGGAYNIQVEDGLGCINFIQVLVPEPDSFFMDSILVAPISCNGLSDGNLTVSVSGGNYPYAYNWNNTQFDSIAIGLGVGTHFITVTDAQSCEITAAFSLTPPEPLTFSIRTDSVNCFGENSGRSTIEMMGGTPPYDYNWDANANSQMSATAVNLPIGTYTVTISDANNCEITASAIIEEPTELTTQMSMTPADCYEATTGAAMVIANGGTGNLNYEWNNGDITPTIQNISAGLAYVTVTDANNCQQIDSIQVTQADSLSLELTITDLECFGDNDGQIEANVSGGTGMYTYIWDNNQTAATATNLMANTYCLTVTDANNCMISDCGVVSQPDSITLSAQTNPAGCDGANDGSIDLSVSGGAGGYTFNWNINEQTEDIAMLTEGDYSVTVTDMNQCEATLMVSLEDAAPITVSVNQVNILCAGNNTGSIDLTVSGGNDNFTFNWTGPNGFTANTEDLNNLFAGNYFVTISDTEGCDSEQTITIIEPAIPLTGTIDTPDVICFGGVNGMATANVTGGAPPYNFLWSSGSNTQVASSLAANDYEVTVTDQNSCSIILNTTIVQQGPLALSLTHVGASCFNGNDGTAQIQSITFDGQAANINDFDINWNNPAQSNTPQITNLIGGENYAVTITDALGCIATANVTIFNPEENEASIEIAQPISCFEGADGNLTAIGEGGTAPYSFLWSNSANNQTTQTATNLEAGNYNVTVIDNNNCSTTAQFELNNPPPINLSFINTDVFCNGEANGTANVNINGGQSPYQINWENGDTDSEATNLLAGYQSITITDNLGCEIVDSTLIEQPATPVTAQFEVEDPSCFGFRDGVITAFPEGGTPPYAYSTDGIAYFGSANIIGLSAGEYDVFIRDARGCIYSEANFLISEPEPVMVSLGNDTTLNYGQAYWIEPDLFGVDQDNYTYQWFVSDTTATLTNPTSSATGTRIFNPTTYTLVATDANGCKGEDKFVIFVDKTRSVFVPTGFTPQDANSINNQLHVHGSSSIVKSILRFQVFDRWGELLYQIEDFDINDTTIGWDGTFKNEAMPAGVYVWVLEIEYEDGVVELLKGNTTLIR